MNEVERLRAENAELKRCVAKLQENINTLRAWIAAESVSILARGIERDRCDD